MKRCILPTLFFFVCTFSYPVQAQAAVPLAILAASAIGVTMAASATGAYYAKTGHAPEYVSAVAGAAASAADLMFQPSVLAAGPFALVTAASFPNQIQAYIGKEAAIGAKMSSILDHLKVSANSSYSSLKDWIAQYTSPPGYVSPPAGTTVLPYPGGGQVKFTQAWRFFTSSWYLPSGPPSSAFYLDGHLTWFNTENSLLRLRYTGAWQGGTYSPVDARNGDGWTSDPVTPITPGIPNYPQIKENYPSSPAAVKDGVRDVIKDLPPSEQVKADSVPQAGTGSPPAALTQADLQAALAQNTAAVAQKALEAAQAIAAANPTDAAAQIAAQQAALEAARAAEAAQDKEADATEESPPETFTGITDNPFAEAYNPGEYDIPARFESFLDTVKSSGLFSFSSGFFNSLPGGGSPIFTINGGQTFGTHTIDFSQTMTTGLAVLKSILLACFGFLSIRAVIMKR